MRAISLTLPLLVSGVGANHSHDAVASNDATLVTHALDARTNLHCFCLLGSGGGDLLVPIGDASTFQVVRRELDLNLVARQDTDVVHAHLA